MKSEMTTNLLRAGTKWSFPSEVIFSDAEIPLRRGAGWRHQLPAVVVLLIGGAALAALVGEAVTPLAHRMEILLVLGCIGCWRWGWFVLQSARAVVYRYFAYPRLRREAERAVAE